MTYRGKPVLNTTFNVHIIQMLRGFIYCVVLVTIVCLILVPYNASGEYLIQLTHENLEFLDGGLQYSPDGSQIAVSYRRFPGDIGHIGLLDIQHGVPLEVLYSNTPDSGVHSFCWDPDGSHFLLSMKDAYWEHWDLYRGFIYGGELENITNTPNRSEQWPMYRHDGNWLVYSITDDSTIGMDIALRNVQTQWDSIIYIGPFDQKDFNWFADDTMFAYESSLGNTSNLYYYSLSADTSTQSLLGQDPCLSPTGIDLLWSLYISSPPSSDLFVYFQQLEYGPYNPINMTQAYSQLDGRVTDPDWHPTYETPTVIFLHKREQGGRWLGDVWMLWDCMPVLEEPEVVPLRYHVGQPYPNPFNAVTTLPLEITTFSFVKWGLYNTLGQRVIQVTPGTLHAGMHRIVIDGDNLASGNYWVVVNVDGDAEVRKLILLK